MLKGSRLSPTLMQTRRLAHSEPHPPSTCIEVEAVVSYLLSEG